MLLDDYNQMIIRDKDIEDGSLIKEYLKQNIDSSLIHDLCRRVYSF